MITKQILRRAREILERGGWQRKHLGALQAKGPHCIVGAYIVAARELDLPWSQDTLFEFLCSLNLENGPQVYTCLGIFNDDRARTHEQIISLLLYAEQECPNP